jgi:hypothetical protein
VNCVVQRKSSNRSRKGRAIKYAEMFLGGKRERLDVMARKRFLG